MRNVGPFQMLPVTVQFLIAMVAHAIHERMARQFDYVLEEVRVLKESLRAATGCEQDPIPSRAAARNPTPPYRRSAQVQLLRHIIPMGERHLRRVVGEFVDHYHAERNHQGLGNVIPFPSATSLNLRGPVGRHERLGGLLMFYDRTDA